MSPRSLLRRAHAPAGVLAALLIAAFLSATIVVELFGPPQAIAQVKGLILLGLLVLVPALALAGGSGVAMVGLAPRGPAARKLRRMRIIAPNGLLVLLPAAVFLARKAQAQDFDAAFYAVQALELAAGLINLLLLGANIVDGLRMSGRLARRRPAS